MDYGLWIMAMDYGYGLWIMAMVYGLWMIVDRGKIMSSTINNKPSTAFSHLSVKSSQFVRRISHAETRKRGEI
jgi:hypothetical protein